MTRKRTIAEPLLAASAMWVLRVAMVFTGLLATLALVVVLISLVPVMIAATATPALAPSAAHHSKKRFAHRPHVSPSP